MECFDYLENELPTFALIENGFTNNEKSCILMEKGKFYGMGYLSASANYNELDDIKYRLTPYNENDYIRGLIYKYAEQHPYKRVNLGNEFFKQSTKAFS